MARKRKILKSGLKIAQPESKSSHRFNYNQSLEFDLSLLVLTKTNRPYYIKRGFAIQTTMTISISSGSEDGNKTGSSAKSSVNLDLVSIKAHVTGMYVLFG